jgi:transposase
MKQFIGCDAHKSYSVFVAVNEAGQAGRAVKVTHDGDCMREFLEQLPSGSEIAVEAGGSYYWIVDAISGAGHVPHLAHPTASRRRIGGRHKTDERDALGCAELLRSGILPEVWIPPRQLRDERELLRWRMSLAANRTQFKDRIHGVLRQYNLQIDVSDVFGVRGRQALTARMTELPPYTRESLGHQLRALELCEWQLEECERQLEAMLRDNAATRLLQTLPGVGRILSKVLALEIGAVQRFPGAAELASYAGLVPRAYNSGGHCRQGRCGKDVNHYLKWAYVEAASVVVRQQHRRAGTHIIRLYQRVRQKTDSYGKAAVAVGRHLAEASYWMLMRQQEYREPGGPQARGRPVKSRRCQGKRVLSLALEASV